ncbi:hypothetical protein NEOLEDRAFT_1143619 [Neolentinus lepideus HHB14362 ss-1]|uniref:Uncharacterized protein n=1 Tax=Neolentinus lepideus HHB14362 ss-1 TaxID=1314782 RepID=A0A165MFE9_9AGAM|nr:hypothetical protein NEOLEDRAFT_1143619 [Neolentinus lepideus HHB14362 ss-1]
MSDSETLARVLNRLLPSLNQHTVDETQFESTLRHRVKKLYQEMMGSMTDEQTRLEIQELIEKLVSVSNLIMHRSPCLFSDKSAVYCPLWSNVQHPVLILVRMGFGLLSKI